MKLRKGIGDYPIPPHEHVVSVTYDPGEAEMLGHRTHLCVVSIEEVEKRQEAKPDLGIPQLAAFCNGHIHLWPAPEAAAELVIVYTPPAQVY